MINDFLIEHMNRCLRYAASVAFLISSAAFGQAATVAAEADAAAKLYAPQQEHAPYKQAEFVRDVAYGARPRNLLDVAHTQKSGGRAKPVLIFVPGGPGNRIEVPGYLFYDNVLLWAVDNGFVGVNMQRDSGPDTAWDTGAKNIAAVIAWTQTHIHEYGGDPERIYVWGHSMGATALAVYVSHPEYHGPQSRDIRGAILHSGAYNIAPIKATKPGRAGAQAMQDPQALLTQSSLPGLLQTRIPLLLAAADGDPQDRPEYVDLLRDALCKSSACPSTLLIKDHNHMSEIFSVNSKDRSVSQPILKWLRRIDRS